MAQHGKTSFGTWPHGTRGLAQPEPGLLRSPLPLRCRHEARARDSFVRLNLNTLNFLETPQPEISWNQAQIRGFEMGPWGGAEADVDPGVPELVSTAQIEQNLTSLFSILAVRSVSPELLIWNVWSPVKREIQFHSHR